MRLHAPIDRLVKHGKVPRALAILAALAALASAQSPAFEVASIRLYPEGSAPPPGATNGVHISPDGTTITVGFAHLSGVIGWAYHIPTDQVFGPGWVWDDRIGLAAKAAAHATESELRQMLQVLLAERFQLKVHPESRMFPVAVLVVAKKGPRNLQAAGSPDKFDFDHSKSGILTYKNVTMVDLAYYFENRPPLGVNEKILDQTGLTGRFNLTLNVEDFDIHDPVFGGDSEDMRRAFFDFFSSALDKQYGLKLEHRKVPLDCIVVDAGTRIPAEN